VIGAGTYLGDFRGSAQRQNQHRSQQQQQQQQQQVPEPEPKLAPELAPAPEPAPGAGVGARAGTRSRPQRSATTRHLVHHRVVPRQPHEINRDKVVSGVIGHAEFNGCIPIVIGHVVVEKAWVPYPVAIYKVGSAGGFLGICAGASTSASGRSRARASGGAIGAMVSKILI